MLVRDVVGEFEFVKGDDLLHPLLSRGRTVRVDVHPLGHLGVGLARYDPTAVKKERKIFTVCVPEKAISVSGRQETRR